MMWLIAVDGIFGQRAFAPGVGTTNTMDIHVYIEIDKPASAQLMGVLDTEVLLSVIPHTYA